jgi:hypothetical protein
MFSVISCITLSDQAPICVQMNEIHIRKFGVQIM